MNDKMNEVEKALAELKKNYPDLRINNNKSMGSNIPRDISSESYIRKSMKRSNIKNINFVKCKFEKNSFSDSYFQSVNFTHSCIEGNSFTCCNFITSNFNDDNAIYLANNFSQSNFTRCKFEGITILESGLLHVLFHNCSFSNVCFKSSTLEGTRFLGGSLSSVNAGQVNIEFVEFMDTVLTDVIIPFYQLPYIIGIADYVTEGNTDVQLCIDERNINITEYLTQIDNLILYYESQAEYFPICNLQIIQNDIDAAKKTLINGINYAISTTDFRMVRYYCRLAQRHNLLDEFTISRIIKVVEEKLTDNTILPERLNDCIIHAGEIRRILLTEKKNGISYNFHIKTNIQKDNDDGIVYINTLCNKLNDTLSQKDYGQYGFEIAVSNHSPFEIIIDVICAAGAVATIAQVIWAIVEKHKSQHTSNASIVLEGYNPVDAQLYQRYVDTRIELCKEQLLNLRDKYTGKKMNHYIEEITQKLKTDINELYDKDIMIFKKENPPE